MVCGYDDARADRLLAQVVIENLLLDAVHDVTPEKPNHGQIHACIHQSKRIASCDNTIKRRQVLEPATHNLNFGVRAELPAKYIAELFASIYENQSHDVLRVT
jgi:hypothetical protein